MLQKSKSKKSNLLKYTLILPLVFGMLFYVSCTDDSSDNYGLTEDAYSELLENFKAAGGNEELLNDYFIAEELLAKEIENPDNMNSQNIRKMGEVMGKMKNLGVQINRLGDNLYEVEKMESVEYSFSEVDQVPITKGCENLETNDQRKKCMSDNIDKHIASNFDTELGTKLGLSGLQRIYALFKIDQNGNIIDVKARAPHPKLKEETERVINSIPKFQRGGKHNGKLVTVSYVKPIIFKIEE